jgi:uncharacterized protein YbjT (DUF2867 family)
MAERRVLITGATGQQGGATLRHLAKLGGFGLRAMTRKPDSDGAKAARELGAEVVQGDLDDADSLRRALEGVWGVFGVQNTWEAGVEKEEEQGKRLAKVAREAGVQHFVYTSVGSANEATGIPHFDNKFRVEQTVKQLEFPSYVIVRPVFFVENLLSPNFLQGDNLVTALDPKTKLQAIVADDIGKFAARAFTEAEKRNRTEVDLAGDAITMPQAAEGVSTILGRKIAYQAIPLDAVRKQSADFAAMLEWFERVGYKADIPKLEKDWGVHPLNFAEWVASKKA